MATILKLAVCLFPDVTTLDYQGPMELIGFLGKEAIAQKMTPTPAYEVETTYLGYTKDPIKAASAPRVLPDSTYDEAINGEQFDLILVPGGSGTRPERVKAPLLDFLKKQVPGAKYVLTVCTGSTVLAQAGLLDGKRATTNKSVFKIVTEFSGERPVIWVPKARWVVDGKIWTASGVTAGIDMAGAFLEHLVGNEVATAIRGVVEASTRKDDEDEWAAFYGLV